MTFAEFIAEYYWAIIWAVVCIAALIVEFASDALTSVWFIPGALISFFLSIFTPIHWGFQLLIFVVVSVIALVVSRIVLKKIQAKKTEDNKTNTDLLVGKTAVVTEEIDNLAEAGAVRINGLVWSARSVQQEKIPAGTIVRVESITGVKLIVKKDEEVES